MVADDQLRERIEAVLRKLPLRRDIDIASRLNAAVSSLAEFAMQLKAGLAWYPTPAFGFKEASGQPFGWGTFEDEAWAEPARAGALRLVGRSATEAELQGLACGLKTVIEAFDALHICRQARAIPLTAIARRYHRSIRTINRWIEDPAVEFPPIIYIRGRRYVTAGGALVWEQKQPDLLANKKATGFAKADARHATKIPEVA